MPYVDPLIPCSREALAGFDYVIATYLLELAREEDPVEVGAEIAVDQTTGTWTPVPAETPELRQRHVGRLINIHEIPDYEYEIPPEVARRRFVMEIGFPLENFGCQIPMLLSTVFGNLSSRGSIKLLDLALPPAFLQSFPGPQYGVAGLRRLLGIEDRPLLCNVIKPCTGLAPEAGAELVYRAARGGVDIIKDDELIGDPAFSRLPDRVAAYMRRLREADAEKGEKTLFAVNVTDRHERIRENALRGIEAGANAIMISFVTTGLSAVRMLAEDPDITVPIMGHMNFAGVLCESPWSGMSSELLCGKLARLVGIDMVLVYPPQSRFRLLPHKFERVLHTLRQPFADVPASFPLICGGVHPGMVPHTMQTLGSDIIVGAGGSIQGHPGGAVAGAKAFRQAFEACAAGTDLKDAAATHPELAQALERWGVE